MNVVKPLCAFSMLLWFLWIKYVMSAFRLVEPKDAETAGALMTFFLALGLSIGAALSFPLRKLI